MKLNNYLKLAVVGISACLFLSAQSVSANKEAAMPKKGIVAEKVAPKKDVAAADKKDVVVAPKKDAVVTPKKEVADKDAAAKKEAADAKDPAAVKKEVAIDKEVVKAAPEKKEVAMMKCSKDATECKSCKSEKASCGCDKKKGCVDDQTSKKGAAKTAVEG